MKPQKVNNLGTAGGRGGGLKLVFYSQQISHPHQPKKKYINDPGQIEKFKTYLILCQLLNFLGQLNSGYFQQGWWHITFATAITNWWHRTSMSLLRLRAWSLPNKGHRLSLGWGRRIGTLWWCWGSPLGRGLWWGGSLRRCRPLCSITGPLVLYWIRHRFWFLWDSFWSFCSFSTGNLDNLSRLFCNPCKKNTYTLVIRYTQVLRALKVEMIWSKHNNFSFPQCSYYWDLNLRFELNSQK